MTRTDGGTLPTMTAALRRTAASPQAWRNHGRYDALADHVPGVFVFSGGG